MSGVKRFRAYQDRKREHDEIAETGPKASSKDPLGGSIESKKNPTKNNPPQTPPPQLGTSSLCEGTRFHRGGSFAANFPGNPLPLRKRSLVKRKTGLAGRTVRKIESVFLLDRGASRTGGLKSRMNEGQGRAALLPASANVSRVTYRGIPSRGKISAKNIGKEAARGSGQIFEQIRVSALPATTESENKERHVPEAKAQRGEKTRLRTPKKTEECIKSALSDLGEKRGSDAGPW